MYGLMKEQKKYEVTKMGKQIWKIFKDKQNKEHIGIDANGTKYFLNKNGKLEPMRDYKYTVE